MRVRMRVRVLPSTQYTSFLPAWQDESNSFQQMAQVFWMGDLNYRVDLVHYDKNCETLNETVRQLGNCIRESRIGSSRSRLACRRSTSHE